MKSYRDESGHPAYPSEDPYDKVSMRGMSLSCWLVGQIAKGIFSGNTLEELKNTFNGTGSTNLTVGAAVSDFSVKCANEMVSSLHKAQEDRAIKSQVESPKIELLPSNDEPIVVDSPGAEDV
jgi:hypothetical protein